MEEALKAILEEQKGWLQQQIEWQNASIAAHHQQVLEQQQQNMREQQLWINQQNQLLMTQIVAQLEQDRERGKGRPHPVNLASKERDSTGIGGSWLDFMNYVRSSLRSKDVKLVLEWQSNSNGAKYAKLVARKSKGLPLISISLSKLSNSAASEAMASLSLELFKAYTVLHDSFIKEQERCCQLSREISAEKEKSQAIKRKLDAALHSESQRSQKTSDMGNIASPFDSDTSSVTAVLNSSEKQPAAEGQSTKVTSRVVPAHRRAKVRGAILHDAEDEEGS